ncbi:MAG: formate--tetrahydrofolate ligase [Flavobacteriales bacterium]|jgi:formate--tetrahydrofolate ligase
MGKSDIEIAQAANLEHINSIAVKLSITEEDLEHYGKYKAKLPLSLIDENKVGQSNLILVTAMTPTPAGEGKTTVSIGLTEGLNKIGKKCTVVLREPSLGPVFGIKGGAAGGGYSQVVPMEDINLHFTGDFSAIEKANNLLSALIDNNVRQHGENSLGIDPRTVTWKRVMDMNDRSLRSIVSGLGGKAGGVPAETGFNITAASEIMAILCLAEDFSDLKKKISAIYIGDTFDGKPVFAKELKAEGAMAALLKDAIKPNLVQTLEGNPAIIHGGPFANIAQGTNSVIATKTGMSLSEYVVTEAGFGADLGAEKFLDIKCGYSGISPKAVVIVATVRALKFHGGQDLKSLTTANVDNLKKGLVNLGKHIENMQQFGLPVVVAINKFVSDTDEEIAAVKSFVESKGERAELSEGWEKGGDGTQDLARAVVEACASCKGKFTPMYDWNLTIQEKIEALAQKIYGADGVDFAAPAKKQMRRMTELGLDKLPICVAKTQNSISDKASLKGRPSGYRLNVREFEFAAGAGFIIPITGNMLRMPGLPSNPASEGISIDNEGVITGLS